MVSGSSRWASLPPQFVISCPLDAPSSTAVCSLMLVAVRPQQWTSRSESSGWGLPLREHLGPCLAYEGPALALSWVSSALIPWWWLTAASQGITRWEGWTSLTSSQILLLKWSHQWEVVLVYLDKSAGSPWTTVISEHRLCHCSTEASSFPHGMSAGQEASGEWLGRG